MNTEEIAMKLIAHSGDARTLAFRALQAAKNHNYEEAQQLMDESEKASVEAHQSQTDLLVAEANGQKPEVNVLLVHSQDYLMTSMLAQELITEMIQIYKTIDNK